MKTRAAILVEQRKPLEIDEVELPALSYGHVLVEIQATRICGSQLGEIDGAKGPDRFLPHLLGHEAGGIVREVGPEVTQVKPGDSVVVHWRPGAGIQARPVQYRRGSQVINAGNITTFQQYTVVSENRLTKVPADLNPEISALLADTLTTGFGVVCREAAVRIGEACVVIGVGGIGLGVVLAAKLAGAHPVIAVDVHDHKLSKAREFGATHVVNSTREALLPALQQLLPGGADALFEVTGRAAVVEDAWKAVSPKGRLYMVGVMRHDQHIPFNTLPLHYGKLLTGTEGGASIPQYDIPRYVRMIQAGRFDPTGMVSHRCKLEDINAAIATMRSGESIHTLIRFPSA